MSTALASAAAALAYFLLAAAGLMTDGCPCVRDWWS